MMSLADGAEAPSLRPQPAAPAPGAGRAPYRPVRGSVRRGGAEDGAGEDTSETPAG